MAPPPAPDMSPALEAMGRCARKAWPRLVPAVCEPERASAHHLEVSRLELRPIRAGELRGAFCSRRARFEVRPDGAAQVLLNRLRANLELSVGGVPCPSELRAGRVFLTEFFPQPRPPGGRGLRSGQQSARLRGAHRLARPERTLGQLSADGVQPPLSVLVSPGGQASFVAREAGHAKAANAALPTTAKRTAPPAPLAKPA